MATLPYDTLCEVIVLAPPSSYPALCLASRDLRALTVPLLYREISFDWSQVHHSRSFLHSILGNEALGRHVKSVRLCAIDDTAPLVTLALVAMPRVGHLDLTALDVAFEYDPIGMVDAIAGLRYLHSIRVWRFDGFDMNVLLDRLPPMRRVDCDAAGRRLPSLERLIFRSIDTLEYLGLKYYDLDAFLVRDAPGRVWTRMQELHVCNLKFTSMARAFVNLRRLIVTIDPVEPAYMLQDQALFPHLDQLHCVASLSPVPALNYNKRRNLRHLQVSLDLWDIGNTFLTTMRCFEWRALRSLDVLMQSSNYDWPIVRESLQVLLEGCSSLVYFGLTCDWRDTNPTEPVESISSMLGLSPSVQLPCLRFLSLKTTTSEGWGAGAENTGHFDVLLERGMIDIIGHFAGLRVAQLQTDGVRPSVWTWSRSVQTGDFHLTRARTDELRLPPDLADIAALVDADL